ncbi:MAG: hypothetical protein H3C26_17805 [Rhodocyclaceae bacterium]|nr:hypothetical protein [Rhodocyclaceae bacterium]
MSGRGFLALAAALPLFALAAPATARDGGPFAPERERAFLSPESERGERLRVSQCRDDWRDERGGARKPSPCLQRLSPDERRQLRQDLRDADRDMRPRRGDFRR